MCLTAFLSYADCSPSLLWLFSRNNEARVFEASVRAAFVLWGLCSLQGCPQETHFFFVKDSPQASPTANHQPPTATTNCQPPYQGGGRGDIPCGGK